MGGRGDAETAMRAVSPRLPVSPSPRPPVSVGTVLDTSAYGWFNTP